MNNLEKAKDIFHRACMPSPHIEFINVFLKNNVSSFKVVYDIGSSVLHWYEPARKLLPEATICCFEATNMVEEFYIEQGITNYFLGILGKENKNLKVQVHKWDTFVNVYPENVSISGISEEAFNWEEKEIITLKDAVSIKNFPFPDLIKMDVQGSELDIVQGSSELIKNAKAVILELPHMEYNIGAPDKETVIQYMNELGFLCLGEFCKNGPDGDFLFINQNSHLDLSGLERFYPDINI